VKHLHNKVRFEENSTRIPECSRRQFLKEFGVVSAGAAVVAISQASSCRSSSTPPSLTAPETEAIIPSTAVLGKYSPPTSPPPLITVSGTTCTVATDRLYTADHLWIQPVTDDRAVMGITSSMIEIVYPTKLSLDAVGTVLARGDSFGMMEGYKMNVDLLTPVSGRLIERNELTIGWADEDTPIPALADNYRRGWIVVVELTKPSELDGLLSPQKYAELISKH
jgi:glycine cleavage system H protein